MNEQPESREVAGEQTAFSGGIALLSKSLKAVFITLAVCIIGLLLWFLTCGGSFIVDSTTESVIVLKFGKFHGVYSEGWHWFMPYPVNKIIRIPTRKETVISSAFMPSNAAKIRDPNAKSLMGNETGETLIPGIDGYALLSDNSILHSEWALTYRIGNPKDFYCNCMSIENKGLADAEKKYAEENAESIKLDSVSDMLKSQLDAAVIEAGTSLTIDGTYYDPDKYRKTVEDRLRVRIEKLNIGIVMENLTLAVCAPPLLTQTAFQEYQLAKTMAEREVESSRTYAVQQENLSRTEAQKILSEGKMEMERLARTAAADMDEFTQIYTKLQECKSPSDRQTTLNALYLLTLKTALDSVKDKYIIGEDKNANDEVRLHINPAPKPKQEPGAPDKTAEK